MWGQEYEIDFVKNYLSPTIEKRGLDTKIWILDHNYNLWGRVVDEFKDQGLSKYVDGVAWHGFYGDPDVMDTGAHDVPAQERLLDEGGPDLNAPDYATDWAKWSGTFAGILNNWGAQHRELESGARRERKAKHRIILLHWCGDPELADAADHTQRAVLGVRTLCQVPCARRSRLCHAGSCARCSACGGAKSGLAIAFLS
jgi:hypothetical protein